MIYLVILFVLILLSFRYDINGKMKYKDRWYNIMLVVFILLAGLRWRLMTDTPGYIYVYYHQIPYIKDLSFDDYLFGKDIFWVLINSIVKTAGGRYFIVQLIEAGFVNMLIFKYIKKHSKNLFLCLFFYAITCYLDYSMQIMRAAFSIVICLYANDYCLEKKWIKGYALYILAFFFHSQTILMFVLPLLYFLRLNRKGIVFLMGAFFVGYVIQKGLGNYLMLFEMYGDIGEKAIRYSESDYGSQQGNLNFLIVYIFPNLFYSLFSLYYIKEKDSQNGILILEPLIMLGALFLVFQTNMHIAYRYVDYFRLYFVIFYAEVFVSLTKRIRRNDKRIAFFRAFMVFMPYLSALAFTQSITLYTIHPYSSVIERHIDKTRELQYMEVGANGQPPADINEY